MSPVLDSSCGSGENALFEPISNVSPFISPQLKLIMAITQFRLFKICTCIASLLSFFKRLICR